MNKHKHHNFHARTSEKLKLNIWSSLLGSFRGSLCYIWDFLDSCLVLQMDISDAGIRHAVAFNTLNIRHLVDLSPNTVSVAKEFRYCVIAVVVGFATTSIVRSVLERRRRSD